jgi:phosphoribosyl 1,2-cyclic phosphodiesterase
VKFSILASGSGGNAGYFETARTRILIDAGLSCREIERRLRLLGIHPRELDILIITHEHGDHVRGAGPLARRYDLPLYANRKTLAMASRNLGPIPRTMLIETGQTLQIRDLRVETFTKCHDAVDPFGLVLHQDHQKIGLATDLGRSTRLLEHRLEGCHALIMEFNYDPVMLEQGPYPLEVKRRIKGAEGHLSNEQAAGLLRSIMHDHLHYVVLAHLSRTNNHPEKAHHEARDVLRAHGLEQTEILISEQDAPSPLIEL